MIFVEAPVFTRQIKELVDDDHCRQLQLRLVLRPDEGDLIPGGGGLGKIRMAVAGRRKPGGTRVICYRGTSRVQVHMPFAYSKTERDDLTEARLRALRDLVRQEFKQWSASSLTS